MATLPMACDTAAPAAGIGCCTPPGQCDMLADDAVIDGSDRAFNISGMVQDSTLSKLFTRTPGSATAGRAVQDRPGRALSCTSTSAGCLAIRPAIAPISFGMALKQGVRTRLHGGREIPTPAQ